MTTAEIALAAITLVMGGGNIWNYVASRGKAKVDLIQLGQTIAASTIAALKDDRAELLARIDELEAKIDEMSAHIENLEDTIRQMGATPPARPSRHKVTRKPE